MKYLEGATETYCQSFEILDPSGEPVNRILKASYNFKRKKEAAGTDTIEPGCQKGDHYEQ